LTKTNLKFDTSFNVSSSGFLGLQFQRNSRKLYREQVRRKKICFTCCSFRKNSSIRV